MRILICDDQADVALALRLLLKGAGHQTEQVLSPAALLDRLSSWPTELILMDMNYTRDTTSGEEGLRLLSRVRAQHSKIPVVVMTAWSSVDLAVEAMQRGAVDFIQKPWDNSRVLAIVDKHAAKLGAGVRNEMEIARNVQQRLFPNPATMRDEQGIEFGGVCVPAQEVGGDYYDFLDLDGGVKGFVLADVSGKGIPAALLMANLQGSFRSQRSADPRIVVDRVNGLFHRATPPEHFATAFLGVYDPATRWLRFANCGHPPGFLVRSNGAITKLDTTACVLGVLADLGAEEGRVELEPGDLVVLYSDGITEAGIESGPEFGEARLERILRDRRGATVGELLAGVAKAAEDYASSSHMDDMTLVGVRVS